MTRPPPPAPARWGDRLFARLTRVTTSGQLIPEIDGLRFVAIALVVILHVRTYVAIVRPGLYDPPPALDGTEPNPLLWAAGCGEVGVLLFFVISGFILALPFAGWRLAGGRPVRLGGYLLRRATRLEPPYLLSLALLLPLTVLASNRVAPAEAVASAAASAVYLHGPIFGTKSVVNFVTWSLEIEVQFYLLVPLLARVFAVRNRWVRRGLFAAGAGGLAAAQAATGGFEHYPRLALSVLNYGQYFLAGMLLADVYLTDWGGSPGRTGWWDGVWLAGWPVLFAAIAHPAAPAVLPLVLAALFVAALRGRVVRWCLGCRWVVVVGGMCYSIYLLHMAAISAAGRFTMRWATGDFGRDFAVQLALLAGPILLVGAAFFVLVERPCMKRDWPQRLRAALSRSRASATPQLVAGGSAR